MVIAAGRRNTSTVSKNRTLDHISVDYLILFLINIKMYLLTFPNSESGLFENLHPVIFDQLSVYNMQTLFCNRPEHPADLYKHAAKTLGHPVLPVLRLIPLDICQS